MEGKRLKKQPTVHKTSRLRGCVLGSWTEIGPRCSLENTRVGDFSYLGENCIVQNAEIGKFSNIAAAVRIGPTDHPMERPSLHHFTYRKEIYGFGEDDFEFFAQRQSKTTRIGHDTWLGHGAIIMPGVRIGHGAVVGAGAVVTKDVPDYCIAVGVPARVLRRRFSEQEATDLLGIAWWDWGRKLIKERERDFHLPISDFICKYQADGGQK